MSFSWIVNICVLTNKIIVLIILKNFKMSYIYSTLSWKYLKKTIKTFSFLCISRTKIYLNSLGFLFPAKNIPVQHCNLVIFNYAVCIYTISARSVSRGVTRLHSSRYITMYVKPCSMKHRCLILNTNIAKYR